MKCTATSPKLGRCVLDEGHAEEQFDAKKVLFHRTVDGYFTRREDRLNHPEDRGELEKRQRPWKYRPVPTS